MSDDSFIREVNEDLRNEQAKELWSKYGKIIIGVALAIVVLTAGSRYWQYYTTQQAATSGDAFSEAVDLSNDGKNDEAIAKLEELVEEGSGQYPALAKIRIASEFADSGDAEKAVEAFDAIAADASFDDTFRDIARLRAGLVLVDTGTYDQVADRLEALASAGQSFRHSAREGLGLAAWKAGDFKQALTWFNAIANDAQSPSGVRSRTNIMLDLLAGKGVKTDDPANGEEAATGADG